MPAGHGGPDCALPPSLQPQLPRGAATAAAVLYGVRLAGASGARLVGGASARKRR